jgi:hypothetical protein
VIPQKQSQTSTPISRVSIIHNPLHELASNVSFQGTHSNVITNLARATALQQNHIDGAQTLGDVIAEILKRTLDVANDINNLSETVRVVTDVFSTSIERNTARLEKQVEAINRLSAGSLDASNALLLLTLPLTAQFLMPHHPKTAALLSGAAFIIIAVVQKVIFSPLQTLQWLWNFKASVAYEIKAHTRIIGYLLGFFLVCFVTYIGILIQPRVCSYVSALQTRRLNRHVNEAALPIVEKNLDAEEDSVAHSN